MEGVEKSLKRDDVIIARAQRKNFVLRNEKFCFHFYEKRSNSTDEMFSKLCSVFLLLGKRWNEEEKAGVLKAFASHIKKKTKPSLKAIKELKNNKKYFSTLKNRTAVQIRAWISNKIKKN